MSTTTFQIVFNLEWIICFSLFQIKLVAALMFIWSQPSVCLHQLWTRNTANRKLINKSNSLSVSAHFQVSVCVRVLVAGWRCSGVGGSPWVWEDRTDQIPPVSQALSYQCDRAMGAWGTWRPPDPAHLYTPGHDGFFKLLPRLPNCRKHSKISNYMNLRNNRVVLSCLNLEYLVEKSVGAT